MNSKRIFDNIQKPGNLMARNSNLITHNVHGVASPLDAKHIKVQPTDISSKTEPLKD
jgi:hypothetical protein